MAIEIGRIEAIYRYPVKSMRGEELESASLSWHGIEGDRRLAFRRVEDRSGNPWLSASRLHELVAFTPLRRTDKADALPTNVRTPEGKEMPLFGDELAAEISRRHDTPVQMMQLRHGIFDEASLSVIATSTVDEVCRLAEASSDVRRFRPNVLIRTTRNVAFEEDEWVGGTLSFGDSPDSPAVAVTMRDLRCTMVNLDPEGGPASPEVMKACLNANDNHAGVYCAITRIGHLAVGLPVFLRR